MKKLLVLLLALSFSIILCGCSKEEKFSCTMNEDNTEQTFKLTATNDKINEVELTMVLDNSMFGVESLNILSETQKEQIKTQMLTNMGLERDEYPGLEIDIDITHQMVVEIDADIDEADPEILKKIGMDFEDADMSLKNAVKDMEESGATCRELVSE